MRPALSIKRATHGATTPEYGHKVRPAKGRTPPEFQMHTLARRTVMAAAPLLLAAGRAQAAPAWDSFRQRLGTLERQSGGRLGVAVTDTRTSTTAGHRLTGRFPMCSTFKVLACSAVLARVDQGRDTLDQPIAYVRGDLVAYSPITGAQVAQGHLSLGDLCAAGISFSDNTAANLILRHLGGPQAVTAFARQIGDRITRLDRTETTLNTAIPGDPRDTTTPAAMVANLHRLLVRDVLSPASRAQLLSWMRANTTGNARLRAGVPQGWRVGDKTGSGDHGTVNDVAILEPPGREPVLACVYLTQCPLPMDRANAIIAQVGAAVGTLISA